MATRDARRGLARIALAPKLVLIVASVGALMTATLLAIVTQKTSANLIQEFESKGEGIALSLAFALGGNGQGTPSENVGRVRGLLEASRTLNGVSYIYIQDAEGSILAHTFTPSFPPEFVEQNWIEPGELARSGRRVKIAPRKQIETATGRINAIDVAAPIAHGVLGVVHVGMDWSSIERPVAALRRSMLLWSAAVATVAIVAGFALAAAMVVRPIRSLTRVTTEIAEHGDLTQRIEIGSKDEIGQLAASFSRMVGRLSAIHGSLKKSAGVLNNSVLQLGSSTDDQEKAFEVQTAALLQAQATAQQIKDGSVRALDRAGAVLKAAEHAAELGRAGESALETSFAGLSDIRAQVAQIAEQIGSLGTWIEQIGRITATVKDLADQSNMLALNAAIEAVRSGEHGKGFAVVAREIRSLADGSIEATARVREVLGSLGSAIRAAVVLTEQGAQRMEAGLAQVRTSSESLRELSSSVARTREVVREIAAAVDQQHTGIDAIFGAVTEVTANLGQAQTRLAGTVSATAEVKAVSNEILTILKSYRV
jgi:methyl-accepting chemotaxis protein